MKTKTKLTIAVASVLSVAALAGTGYAGWVLSHNVEDKATGNMTAYGVADKTVKLSKITFKDTDNDGKANDSIVWGKAAKAADVKGTWFGYTSDVEDEFFTPVLEFTITNGDDEKDTATPVFEKATITVTDTQAGDYAACLKAGLISGPAVGVATNIKVPTGTNVKNVFSYEMSLVDEHGAAFFGWGTYFKGSDGNPTNPINFYNAKDANGDSTGTSETTGEQKTNPWYEDAKTKMGMIEKLSGVHFEINLTVNHAPLSENK
mgnify:CR=1 FL=1